MNKSKSMLVKRTTKRKQYAKRCIKNANGFFCAYYFERYASYFCSKTLHWRHNYHDGFSNHQPYDGLLNHLFRRRSKENIKAPRHWPLCGEFTGTGEFPAQKASYAENVSIWWRHHVLEKHDYNLPIVDVTLHEHISCVQTPKSYQGKNKCFLLTIHVRWTPCSNLVTSPERNIFWSQHTPPDRDIFSHTTTAHLSRHGQSLTAIIL